MTSVLASPQFLFLVEPRDAASQAETPLDDFATLVVRAKAGETLGPAVAEVLS